MVHVLRLAQVDLVKIKLKLIIPVTVSSSKQLLLVTAVFSDKRGLLVHCLAHVPSRMSPQLYHMEGNNIGTGRVIKLNGSITCD